MRIINEYGGIKIARTVRFTEELFEQLNKIAAENYVSFNMVVLQFCKYALDHYNNAE